MTDLQLGITALLRSALFGTQAQLPEAFDFQQALTLGRAHQILPLLFYGVQNSGLSVPTEVKSALRTATLQSAMVDQSQKTAGDAIFSALEQKALDYMPLKGILRKSAYPQPEMRPMSDLDILIRPEQYDQIRPLMAELGFTESYESDHELAWRKPGGLLVELHKHIIPSYNRDYYAYFGDGWKLAQPVAGYTYRYAMKPEDSLIYELTHMAKHYRDGGIGIRHLTDVYLCAQGEALDRGYIRQELQKLKLWDFYQNVLATGKVWFANGTANEKTDFITEYIFSSGSYGTMDQKFLAGAVRMAQTERRATAGVRWRKLLRMTFPSYARLRGRYPALNRMPVLLPVFWVVRWVEVLFFRPSSIQHEMAGFGKATGKQVDEFEQALRYVGLEFESEHKG